MSDKRYCKKCGRELASINEGKVCQHCRREKGKLLKNVGKGILVFGGLAVTVVGVISKIKLK
ncbi:MAG: hypothetical protein IJ165_07540 [Proteobacteria bacterium]|nr:hypothetical protein [Pseudomonadota bacterium]